MDANANNLSSLPVLDFINGTVVNATEKTKYDGATYEFETTADDDKTVSVTLKLDDVSKTAIETSFVALYCGLESTSRKDKLWDNGTDKVWCNDDTNIQNCCALKFDLPLKPGRYELKLLWKDKTKPLSPLCNNESGEQISIKFVVDLKAVLLNVLLKEKFKEQKVPTGVRCQMEIKSFKIIFNKEIKDQVRVHFGSYDKEEDMHPYMTETLATDHNTISSKSGKNVQIYECQKGWFLPKKGAKNPSIDIYNDKMEIELAVYTTSMIRYRIKKLGFSTLNLNDVCKSSSSPCLRKHSHTPCIKMETKMLQTVTLQLICGTTDNVGTMEISFKLCHYADEETMNKWRPPTELKLFKEKHPGKQCQLKIRSFEIDMKKSFKQDTEISIHFGIKDSVDLRTETNYQTEDLCVNAKHHTVKSSKSVRVQNRATMKWLPADNTLDIFSYSVPINFELLSKYHILKNHFATLNLREIAHHNAIQDITLKIYEIAGEDQYKLEEIERGKIKIKLQLAFTENLETIKVSLSELARRRDPAMQIIIANKPRPYHKKPKNSSFANVGLIKDNAEKILKELAPLIDLGLYISALITWRLSSHQSISLTIGWYVFANNIEYWPILVPGFLLVYNKWYWTQHNSVGKNAENWKDKLKTEQGPKEWAMLGDLATQLETITTGVTTGHKWICDIDMMYIFLSMVVGVLVLVQYGIADETMAIGGSLGILSQQPYIKTCMEFVFEWFKRQRVHGFHGTLIHYIIVIGSPLVVISAVFLVLWYFDITSLFGMFKSCVYALTSILDHIWVAIFVFVATSGTLVYLPLDFLNYDNTETPHLDRFIAKRRSLIKLFNCCGGDKNSDETAMRGNDEETIQETRSIKTKAENIPINNSINRIATSSSAIIVHNEKKKNKNGSIFFLLLLLICSLFGIRKGYNSIQQSIETVRLREELATHFDEIDLNKDHGKK